MYIHGSATDSNSMKARHFRERFPGMVTPDFKGSFEERMNRLRTALSNQTGWTLIGSSYGGLMATVYALENEAALRKLILLAPALMLNTFITSSEPNLITVPTILIHGTLDTVVPMEPVREIAQNLFANLTIHIVEDDHRLHKTANELDWKSILD
jgi:pimeloyl-ACP methyl ester carboxylesterase